MENTAGGKYRRKHNRSKPYERKQKPNLVTRIATSVKSWFWSSGAEVEKVNSIDAGTTSNQNGDSASIDTVYEDAMQVQKTEDKKDEPSKIVINSERKIEIEKTKAIPQFSLSHVEKPEIDNAAPVNVEQNSLVKQLWKNKEVDYSQRPSFKKLHSPQFDPMSAALSRSSINGSLRSPSKVNSSITQESNNSLYYPGATRYMGANSSMNNLFETSFNTSSRYAKLPRVQKVVVTPIKKRKVSFAESHETTTTTPLSSTATKILEAMRQITTPINDVKRIPISDRKSTPYANRSRRKRHLPNHSIVRAKQSKPPVKSNPMVPTPAKTVHVPQPMNNSISSMPPITSKSPPGGGKIKSAHHRSHTSTVKSTPVTTNKFEDLPKKVEGLPAMDFKLVHSTPAVKTSSSKNVEKIIESPATSPVKNDDKKPTIAFSFASPAVTTKSLVKDEDNTKTTKLQFTFSDPTKPMDTDTKEPEVEKPTKLKRTSFGLPSSVSEVESSPVEAEKAKPVEAPTKPKPAAKWSCPVCMVSNDVSALSCVCCGEPQPGCKPAPKQDKKLPESTFSFGAPAGGGITFGAPKTDTASKPAEGIGFGFGGAGKVTFGQSKTAASTSTSEKSAFNTGGEISFGTNKPIKTTPKVILPPKPSVQKAKSGKKWECEVCLLQNAVEEDKCVACGAPNPDMVPDPNKKQAEFKYGAAAEDLKKTFSAPAPVKPADSNLLTTKPVETEAVKEKPSFSFTSPSTNEEKVADPKPLTTSKEGEQKAPTLPTLNFGGPKITETKTVPSFDFGKKSEDKSDKSLPKISFATPKSANDNKQEPSKPLLSFGAPKEKTSTDLPKFGGFVAKTEDKKEVTEPKTSGFSFGASATKTTETSSGSKAPGITFGKPAESSNAENKTSAPTFSFGKPAEAAKTETKEVTGDKPKSLFSFGNKPTSTIENKTESSGDKPKSLFSFGNKPTETSTAENKTESSGDKASSLFGFGKQEADNKTEPSVAKTTGFSFGKPAETLKTDNKSATGFMFGQKSTPSTTQAAAQPTFGLSTEKKSLFGNNESAPATSTTNSSGFSFGGQAKAEQPKKTEAIGGFNFGGAGSTEPAKSTFSLGSKPAAAPATGFGGSSSGFSFGSKPAEASKPAFGGFGANKAGEGFGSGSAKPAVTSSTPSIFGGSTNSTFGAAKPAESKSIFGGASTNQTPGSVFGQQNKPAEKPGFSFGKPAESENKSFSFGSNAANNTGFSGGFGQNSTPQKSMFGESKPASQGSMFGSQNTNSGGLFGAKKETTGSSMFGAKPAQPTSTGFSFNSPASTNNAFNAKPSTGFNFSASKPKESGFQFGSNQQESKPAASSGFNFGSNNSTGFGSKPAASTGFAFGQNQQQSASQFSFNSATPDSNAAGGGMFNVGGSNQRSGNRPVRKAIRRNKR